MVDDQWYWKGLDSGPIQDKEDPESHWSGKSFENDCLYFSFKGLNSSSTGWESWPHGCNNRSSFACEKAFELSRVAI